MSEDVFERHKISRRLLPVGCFVILLTKCTEGNDIEIFFSSTSKWYMLKTDSNVLYTNGITFVEVNSLPLPISLDGVEIRQRSNEFSINIGTSGYKNADGIQIDNKRTDHCLSFEVTPSDMFDFISNESFLKSFLSSLKIALPDWANFAVSNTSVLNVQDLRSELVKGSKLDEITWCKGAPVLPTHLYTVFQFDSNFFLSVYNDAIELPHLLHGEKFCLIVDMCHNYGGSVFFMVPEESQTFLAGLEVFRQMREKQNLQIMPRGIGVSVVKGINVHYAKTQLQLWNGDRVFYYP